MPALVYPAGVKSDRLLIDSVIGLVHGKRPRQWLQSGLSISLSLYLGVVLDEHANVFRPFTPLRRVH